MKYRFLKSTMRHREGDVIDMNPKHDWTKKRLERGIVEPVKEPKAAKRETKVVEPVEAKDDSQDN